VRNFAVEGLDACQRWIGIRRYRNDYGSIVYSETEVALWWWIVYHSRRLPQNNGVENVDSQCQFSTKSAEGTS
jgi:hypothetical protein